MKKKTRISYDFSIRKKLRNEITIIKKKKKISSKRVVKYKYNFIIFK